MAPFTALGARHHATPTCSLPPTSGARHHSAQPPDTRPLSVGCRAVRRVSFVLAVVGVTLFASGCGDSSNTDVVASVNDVQLDRDTFEDLVNASEATNGTPVDSQADADAARTDGDTARAVVGKWVTGELVHADLDAMGVAVPAVDTSLTGAEKADAEFNALANAWVAQGDDVLGDQALENWYDEGPAKSEIACVQHILVANESDAQAVLDRLDAGEAFADVAASASLHTQSAAQGGALGCRPLSAFTQSFIPEFVEGSLAAEIGVPTQPVASQFGQHVIRVMPFDERSSDDVILPRLIALGHWHHVDVDPQIGAWQSGRVE